MPHLTSALEFAVPPQASLGYAVPSSCRCKAKVEHAEAEQARQIGQRAVLHLHVYIVHNSQYSSVSDRHGATIWASGGWVNTCNTRQAVRETKEL